MRADGGMRNYANYLAASSRRKCRAYANDFCLAVGGIHAARDKHCERQRQSRRGPDNDDDASILYILYKVRSN